MLQWILRPNSTQLIFHRLLRTNAARTGIVLNTPHLLAAYHASIPATSCALHGFPESFSHSHAQCSSLATLRRRGTLASTHRHPYPRLAIAPPLSLRRITSTQPLRTTTKPNLTKNSMHSNAERLRFAKCAPNGSHQHAHHANPSYPFHEKP